MKVLLYADPHFCATSSIVRSRGDKYTTRLENEIKSITWAEQLAEETECGAVICLGDFFDRSDLNAEELTALKDIKWAENLTHYFLVGNHEMGISDLSYNSANALSAIPNSVIVSEPSNICGYHLDLYMIPYILETERKPLREYIDKLNAGVFKTQEVKNIIVLSHNDLKGIQYGPIESKEGFDLKEIEDSCHLFINGHIHNGAFLNKKQNIINLGNLTGQNFNEDASQYKHCVAILDLSNMELHFVENPYAFNFYKLEQENIDFDSLSNNAVVTVKCPESKVAELRDKISKCPKIVESRIISIPEVKEGEETKISSLANLDHIEQFKSYILQKLGNSDVVINELTEISK